MESRIKNVIIMVIVDLLNKITSGSIHEVAIPVVEFTSKLWQSLIQPILMVGIMDTAIAVWMLLVATDVAANNLKYEN